MSVQTRANECVDNAQNCVNEAIKSLAEILIEECWGHDEYKGEFDEKLNSAFNSLRHVKKLLG